MIYLSMNHDQKLRAAKSRIENLAREIRGGSGKSRAESLREAMRQDPEARRDLVCAHNLKHGRKRQAEEFAARFDEEN